MSLATKPSLSAALSSTPSSIKYSTMSSLPYSYAHHSGPLPSPERAWMALGSWAVRSSKSRTVPSRMMDQRRVVTSEFSHEGWDEREQVAREVVSTTLETQYHWFVLRDSPHSYLC